MLEVSAVEADPLRVVLRWDEPVSGAAYSLRIRRPPPADPGAADGNGNGAPARLPWVDLDDVRGDSYVWTPSRSEARRGGRFAFKISTVYAGVYSRPSDPPVVVDI